MPELPEVETIVAQLREKITKKKVVSVRIFDKIAAQEIERAVPFTIINILRKAKYIIFVLDNNKFILTHLGMTGQFFYASKEEFPQKEKAYSKFPIARFSFTDGSVLFHGNARKFGSMHLIDKAQLDKLFLKLGPEPLEPGFSASMFAELLKTKPKANLKTTLMDQSFISGIGNIYAQEALYYAGISPLRKVNTLTPSEINKLYLSIRDVLKLGIKYGGVSVDNYIKIDGTYGEMQKHLAVYQQEHCPKKHPVKKINLGGRGTSYCPVCQK